MPQDSRSGTKEKDVESGNTYRIPDNKHCPLALHDLASSAERKVVKGDCTFSTDWDRKSAASFNMKHGRFVLTDR